MTHRGRPKKYLNGSSRWSGNLPLDVVQALRAMPNASEWVSMILSNALKLHSMDLKLAELKQVKEELLEFKRQILLLEQREADIEISLEIQQAIRNRYQDARQEHLEHVILGKEKRKDAYGKAWYESRADILEACGFKSVEEAIEWQESELRKWREANR